jgi:Flp pilus assembly protein TadG
MNRKHSQLGATIAEAAITVVALFTLILGAVDFGRAFSIYENLTDAAREGARFAVAPDPASEILPSGSQVQSYVAPFLAADNVSGTVTVTSTSHVINSVTTTYTQVTVQAPYKFLFFPFGTVNISSSSEMRNETN